MLIERLIAFMKHFASFSVGDLFTIPIAKADPFHEFFDQCELAGTAAPGDRSD